MLKDEPVGRVYSLLKAKLSVYSNKHNRCLLWCHDIRRITNCSNTKCPSKYLRNNIINA